MPSPTPPAVRWDLNWSTIWDHVAATVPDEPAVLVAERSLTFREFEDRASRLAAALARLGLARGDKLGICSHNLPEYLETIYAAFKLGVVPVNMNFRYRAVELAELLRVSRARAVVHPRSLRGAVAGAVDLVGGEVRRIEIADGDDPGTDQPGDDDAIDYEQALRERWEGPDERSGADEMFMFTGGTTGRPKAVVWRHGDLLDAQLVTITQPLGLPMPTTAADILGYAEAVRGRAPRTLPLAPFMHATALFMSMDGLLLGGPVIVTGSSRLDPAQALRAAERHRASRIVIAGNAIATPLIDEIESALATGSGYDLSRIDLVLSSGMAWTDDRKLAMIERLDATLMDILGSSEGGPYAYSFVRSAADLPSRIALDANAEVVGADFRPVPVGEVGVLGYRGPMPLGYFEDPERTAATYREVDGVRWVTVGDWVRRRDDTGGIEFLGRGAAVVNTGGEKVYPAEVEEVLLEHPVVVDAVVFGLPDPRWGEQVVAVVAIRAGTELAEADAQVFVGERLAGYKKPQRVRVVPSLERSPSGKVDLAALARLFDPNA